MKQKRIFGIPVPHHKNTAGRPTGPLLKPARVTIPLSQHIGAPAKALVKKGDTVFVGTRIADAHGFVSANIHSSVSGTVADVTDILLPGGKHAEAVVIDSDGAFTPDPAIAPPAVTDAASLASAIAGSGLVGLGGAGFPTHVKLSPPEGTVLDTLLLNGAECEPYITSDDRLMVEETDDILAGAKAVAGFLGLSRIVIAVERNKPEAIRLLTEKAGTDAEICILPDRYPQGAEKVLICNALGRIVPAGKLPADVGVLVLNVGSAAFIAKYLRTGMPLVEKRITVDGGAVADPQNLRVPVGTPIKEVIEACGGYKAPCAKLLMGGPMMGTALWTDDYPVLKNNNAILALDTKQAVLTVGDPCIRCGRCVMMCPMRLSPVEIHNAREAGDVDEMNKLGVMNCIECGSCTFVCPAKRPVTQSMRLAKQAVRKAVTKK